MKKMFVKINGISDVSAFVANAIKVEDDITVTKGKYVINGKSLMGMFSLDLSTGITVEYPEHALMFEDFLKKFKAD